MMAETREAAKLWALQNMPSEACGLVIIEKGKEVFVPCKNVSEIDDQFEIDVHDYAEAEDRGDIVRIFHSHVYIGSRPSEADKVSCEASGLPWSIISVPNGDWTDFEPSGYRAPLVGRTWSHGVLDCYSLIRDYYKEVLNIEIPDFDRKFEWWLKGDNLYLENFEKAGFYEVSQKDIKNHDVVLMQIKSPVINHGGIYQDGEKLLHHLYKRLSGTEIYGGYYLKHTAKVLRHKECAL